MCWCAWRVGAGTPRAGSGEGPKKVKVSFRWRGSGKPPPRKARSAFVFRQNRGAGAAQKTQELGYINTRRVPLGYCQISTIRLRYNLDFIHTNLFNNTNTLPPQPTNLQHERQLWMQWLCLGLQLRL